MKKITLLKHNKSAALLIVLLTITIIGTVAFTLARSVISGIGFTTNISDSMTAEEASKAGLEYGLLKFKQGSRDETFHRDFNGYSEADITISRLDGPPYYRITSIGHVGFVYIKHTLTPEITSFTPFKIMEGDTVTFAGATPDAILTCPYSSTEQYVAIGAGHWQIDPADSTETRQYPWLKCRKLAPGITLDMNDTITWDSAVPEGIEDEGWAVKRNGNYVIVEAGHHKSDKFIVKVDRFGREIYYYQEYTHIKWAKLEGANVGAIYSDRAQDRAPIHGETVWKSECDDEDALIGDGHWALHWGTPPYDTLLSNEGEELEITFCAELYPPL